MANLTSSTPAGVQSLQSIANTFRNFPELNPLMGQSGWTQEPTLSIANDVMQRILAQDMDWKWNRKAAAPFITVSLQQDYCTNITDMGWVEKSVRYDVNNTAFPKPQFLMEASRDLQQTSAQWNPFQIAWIPNSLARMGVWQAATAYACGYGVAQMPTSPIQQFLDVNGNILFIDSTTLNLSSYSPGSNGPLPDFGVSYPYGISGSVQPFAPPNSPGGTKVSDGSIIWTVADPNGIAWRFNTVPAQNSICWLIAPEYQIAPPILTSLQQLISPIPASHTYLFRQGFLAFAQDYAGSNKATASYAKWELAMMTALRSDDRETDQNVFYPSDSLTSGGYGGYAPIGPAWPFGW